MAQPDPNRSRSWSPSRSPHRVSTSQSEVWTWVASAWDKPARAYRNGSQTLAGVTQAWVGTGPVNQWGMDLGDLDGDHKLDAIAGGDQFRAPLLIQVYRNASTGGQNITFDTEAPRGGAIDEVSHDVELAPLPAMH